MVNNPEIPLRQHILPAGTGTQHQLGPIPAGWPEPPPEILPAAAAANRRPHFGNKPLHSHRPIADPARAIPRIVCHAGKGTAARSAPAHCARECQPLFGISPKADHESEREGTGNTHCGRVLAIPSRVAAADRSQIFIRRFAAGTHIASYAEIFVQPSAVDLNLILQTGLAVTVIVARLFYASRRPLLPLFGRRPPRSRHRRRHNAMIRAGQRVVNLRPQRTDSSAFRRRRRTFGIRYSDNPVFRRDDRCGSGGGVTTAAAPTARILRFRAVVAATVHIAYVPAPDALAPETGLAAPQVAAFPPLHAVPVVLVAVLLPGVIGHRRLLKIRPHYRTGVGQHPVITEGSHCAQRRQHQPQHADRKQSPQHSHRVTPERTSKS